MGFDQHGAAYPEKPCGYSCPVCGICDCDAYLRCYDGGCPDGRDQSRLRPAWWDDPRYDAATGSYRDQAPTEQPRWQRLLIAAITGAVVAFVMSTCMMKAHAFDHGFDPLAPTTKWMEKLQRPDDPSGSCCGIADAYQADTYIRHPDGSYTITITDGSAIEFPDGTHRDVLKDGTVIEVPASHVNPPVERAGNPTGHAWLFTSVYGVTMEGTRLTSPGTTYCFVPLPEGY